MMPLTDLYALYNRARGTNLVSPDDLVQACALFPNLGLPFRLRRFDSGVLVVQSTAFSEERVVQRIEELVEQRAPLTAANVAKEFSVSLQLAYEQLVLAEQHLVLCRDETLAGVFFYANLFERAAPLVRSGSAALEESGGKRSP